MRKSTVQFVLPFNELTQAQYQKPSRYIIKCCISVYLFVPFFSPLNKLPQAQLLK